MQRKGQTNWNEKLRQEREKCKENDNKKWTEKE